MADKPKYDQFAYIINDFSVLKDIEDLGALWDRTSWIRGILGFKRKVHLKRVLVLEDIEKIISDKVPSWVIGISFHNNIIILDKKKWKNNFSSLSGIILHEFIHIALASVCKTELPLWINEGLAVCLSGQIKTFRPLNYPFYNTFDFYALNYASSMVYDIAGWAVYWLIETYGLQRIIKSVLDGDFLDQEAIWSSHSILEVICSH